MRLNNHIITLLGLASGLSFLLICYLISLTGEEYIIALLFYIIGGYFGIFMSIGLNRKSFEDYGMLLAIISFFEFFLILMYSSLDYEFLGFRRITMGGFGAIIFLFTVRLIYKLKFTYAEYLIGFIFGIASTYLIWNENYYLHNNWILLACCALWQTGIAYIINRKNNCA